MPGCLRGFRTGRLAGITEDDTDDEEEHVPAGQLSPERYAEMSAAEDLILTITANGAGSITNGELEANEGGAISSTSFTGSYSVSGNGRAAVTLDSTATARDSYELSLKFTRTAGDGAVAQIDLGLQVQPQVFLL